MEALTKDRQTALLAVGAEVNRLVGACGGNTELDQKVQKLGRENATLHVNKLKMTEEDFDASLEALKGKVAQIRKELESPAGGAEAADGSTDSDDGSVNATDGSTDSDDGSVNATDDEDLGLRPRLQRSDSIYPRPVTPLADEETIAAAAKRIPSAATEGVSTHEPVTAAQAAAELEHKESASDPASAMVASVPAPAPAPASAMVASVPAPAPAPAKEASAAAAPTSRQASTCDKVRTFIAGNSGDLFCLVLGFGFAFAVNYNGKE